MMGAKKRATSRCAETSRVYKQSLAETLRRREGLFDSGAIPTNVRVDLRMRGPEGSARVGARQALIDPAHEANRFDRPSAEFNQRIHHSRSIRDSSRPWIRNARIRLRASVGTSIEKARISLLASAGGASRIRWDSAGCGISSRSLGGTADHRGNKMRGSAAWGAPQTAIDLPPLVRPSTGIATEFFRTTHEARNRADSESTRRIRVAVKSKRGDSQRSKPFSASLRLRERLLILSSDRAPLSPLRVYPLEESGDKPKRSPERRC